ncbi:hypothetical protein Peur_062981 [Populus x canadensis]
MDLVLSLDKLQTPVRFHVDLNSELGDPEILPHLQSFPAYDQQDYSLDDFSQDDPSQMLTEQVHSNNGLAGNVYVTCRSV